MRCAGFIGLALFGCGRTTGDGSSDPEPPVAPADVSCDGALPPGELSLLSDSSSEVGFGPCGELSYTSGGQVYLADASLSQVRLLEGATSLPIFDPRGRSMFFVEDDARTLVHEDLRSAGRWSAELLGPNGPMDFYAKPGRSGLFRCEGAAVLDYDDAGNATRHELDGHCFGLYSGLDALLLSRTTEGGYMSVELGTWEKHPLGGAGSCGADACELELIRRLLKKQEFVSQLMGDHWVQVPLRGPRYYDARSGAEVGGTALIVPNGGVVGAPGFVMYLADDHTMAVTDDSVGADETVLRYFGPDPRQPERWLATEVTFTPRRSPLRALPSDDRRRVAVWSDDCGLDSDSLLMTFEPGEKPEFLGIEGCVLRIHWVGSDGTLLAQVWLEGSPWLGVGRSPLVLIAPDGELRTLDIDLERAHGIRQVVSNGRTLLISSLYAGPLYAVDLETAQSREAAPAAGQLLTDSSRERLAFQVPSSSAGLPAPLWAGAFPR